MTSPEPEPAVSLVGLAKRYAEISGLDLDLAPGSFTALLGPSGCGKTTTLSMVNGLVVPDAGDVLVAGESMAGRPPERRPMATVFQKPLLFGHLDVAGNVAFGLRMRRVARAERGRRVADALRLVRLDGFGPRRVAETSGGQEQRIALARALVLRPRVLLLDEPFSQLDAALRAEMRALVTDIHRRSGVTTLLVTHDRAEAVETADRIALMTHGRLDSVAAPRTFFERPPTLHAARFFGTGAELPGRATGSCFETRWGRFTVAPPTDTATDTATATATAGDGVLVVRPERMRLSEPGPNTVRGRIVAARFAGTHVRVEVEADAGLVLSVDTAPDGRAAVGASVSVHLPPDACTVVPPS